MKTGFRPAVFVVVYQQNPKTKRIEYLILKRRKHWKGWEFVKGGIDAGESIKSAVRREVYEESGNRHVKISRYPFSGTYRYKNVFPDRPGFIGQSYTLWSAEVPFGKKIRYDSKEHSGFAWLPFERAVRLLTYRNQKKCLSIVNSNLVKN